MRYLTVSVSGIVCNCSGCPEEDIAVGVITIVEVPGGVTMGGGVTAALPPPQPATPNATQRTTAPSAPLKINCLLSAALPNVPTCLKVIKTSNASASKGNTRSPPNGLNRTRIVGGKMAPPLVETVMVNSAGAPFATDTLEGT